MFNPDGWTTIQPKWQQDQLEDSVEIILEENWTKTNTPKRTLNQCDFGDIPMEIIRSTKIINEVQAYQEEIKVR